jgi:hypothetical protein
LRRAFLFILLGFLTAHMMLAARGTLPLWHDVHCFANGTGNHAVPRRETSSEAAFSFQSAPAKRRGFVPY